VDEPLEGVAPVIIDSPGSTVSNPRTIWRCCSLNSTPPRARAGAARSPSTAASSSSAGRAGLLDDPHQLDALMAWPRGVRKIDSPDFRDKGDRRGDLQPSPARPGTAECATG